MTKHKIASKARNSLAGLHRRHDVPVRQHGLDLAIYDPVSEKVHILNPVAAAFWNQFTPDRTFTQVQEMLALTFKDTKSAQITRDLTSLIKKLRTLKLLVPSARRKEKRSRKKNKVIIPGLTINTFDRGYKKPAVKTYTLAQLNRLVQKAGSLKMFCDLLVMPRPNELVQ